MKEKEVEVKEKKQEAKASSPSAYLAALDHWWFARKSPTSLGVLRIIVCLVTFATLLLTFIDFEAWYTESGYLPNAAVHKYMDYPSEQVWLIHKLPFAVPRLNLLSSVTNDGITMGFYIIVMLLALLGAVGLFTRPVLIALAVGYVSIHHRNPLIMHSGDSLLRLLVIYLAIVPGSTVCSLDRVIGMWKGKLPKIAPPVSIWGQRLIQYQIGLVYFTTAWHKMYGTYWKDGTATWYPSQLREFDRFPVPAFLEQHPFIWITTYGTLAVELAMATLVFYRPWRKLVLISGIMLHFYIEYRFNIPFFGVIIVSSYIAFYDGEEVVAWAKRFGDRLRRLHLHVHPPAGTELRPGPEAALEAVDPLGVVRYGGPQEENWVAVDSLGRKRNPFRQSWNRSIGAWPIGLVPGLWKRMLVNGTQPKVETEGEADAEQPAKKVKAER